MSRTFLPVAAAFALALSACATPADPGTLRPPPTEPPPSQMSCNPEAAQPYIGQVATADVVEKARVAAGAEVARILKPGQVVTMEYRSGRLNIDVNERNVVTGARCG